MLTPAHPPPPPVSCAPPCSQAVLAEKIRVLHTALLRPTEEGEPEHACTVTSSGMAAITNTFMALLRPG